MYCIHAQCIVETTKIKLSILQKWYYHTVHIKNPMDQYTVKKDFLVTNKAFEIFFIGFELQGP